MNSKVDILELALGNYYCLPIINYFCLNIDTRIKIDGKAEIFEAKIKKQEEMIDILVEKLINMLLNSDESGN